MQPKCDSTDMKILRTLAREARSSLVEISNRVGLSTTACARRIEQLEKAGIIRGYLADIDAAVLGFRLNVLVSIALDRQSEDVLANFEKAINKCPDVVSCHLMSGTNDYLVHLQARDMENYERIHKQYLSRLPGVARVQSSFAMRSTIKRNISLSVLGG